MRFPTMLLILSATFLPAQGPPGPPGPPRHDEAQQALGLSEDQVKQLMDLRRQERESLRSAFEQIREKRKALHDATEAGSPDPAALCSLLLELRNLQKQMKETNDRYREQAIGVLTEGQKQKLKGLEEAAKLAPAVRQGVALNLLAPPDRPGGWGLFRDHMGGPMGLGPRGGPGFGMGRAWGRRL